MEFSLPITFSFLGISVEAKRFQKNTSCNHQRSHVESMMFRSLTVLVLATLSSVDGFSSALFQEAPALKTTAPSLHEGVDVELPDFEELFNRIQQVSPLARQVISGVMPGRNGFDLMEDDTCK